MKEKEKKGFNALDPNSAPETKNTLDENSKGIDLGEGALNQEIFNREVKEINDKLNAIEDPELREQTVLELLKAEGLEYNTSDEMKQDLGLEPGQWIVTMGWKVLQQTAKIKTVQYPLMDLIPTEMVALGKVLYAYSDYFDADELAAYGDYGTAEEYYTLLNPKGTIQVEEAWHVYKNLHKGLKLPSTMLNDVTYDMGLYVKLVRDLKQHVERPIDKAMYRFILQMIQDPEKFQTGLDWTTRENVITIDATDAYDALTKLHDLFDSFKEPSRQIMPEAWIPQGMTIPLELTLSMSDYVAIVPNNFKNTVNVQMKSGRYHENFLDVMPEMRPMDYDKVWGEQIQATNYGKLFEDADIILVPKQKHKVIQMYQGVRQQPLLYFADVYHFYMRFGHAYDKNFPIWKIKLNVKPIEDGDDTETPDE